MRVVKPGSPSFMDPTEKVESTVESMTIQQYEAELWRKELQQVRPALRTTPRAASPVFLAWPSSPRLLHQLSGPCRPPAMQACISVGMAAGLMHIYFGYVQPLVITGIFAPYSASCKPMFRVHVLGGAFFKFVYYALSAALAVLCWLRVGGRYSVSLRSN